ncbi:PQQ-binding-like beta-propeller repeat protein [Saccharicrinis sp. FJH54]|uniref:outer membrane protein assembly factor BamB family protein n=1 Tax=Saccharicrinis sp. FJH54 TaxID=3344665 RepID=UPI0035D4F669
MKPLMLLSLVVLLSCTPKANWSKWRGPEANGKITSNKPWKTNLDSTLIAWQKNIGKGHSAITVQDNNCYVSGWTQSVNGTDTINETVVRCLNIETGDDIWTYTYPSAERSFPGPRSTPVIDEDNLFILSWEGTLYCLSAEDGKEKWKRDIYSDSLIVRDRWGICSSPVIYKNLLLLNLNHHGIAFDKTNGQLIWNSPRGSGAFSSTTLFDYNGIQAGTFMSDSSLYIVDVSNGTILNTYPSDKNFRKENDVILTDDPDQLFLSNELIRKEGAHFRSVWRNDTVASAFRTGVIVDGYVYQFNNFRNKMKLFCLDLSSGKEMWNHTYDLFGSVSAVDDKLVILSGLGKVAIVETNPEEYTELSILQVLPSINKNTHWCWTAPTFTNGKIFVRNSNGDLACINVGS